MKTQKALKIVRFCLPVVTLAVWGGKPVTVRVPEKPVCLEQAAKKIRLDSKVTLVLQNHEKAKGRLVFVDPNQSFLTISDWKENDTVLHIYQSSDISKIEYNGGGRLQRMVLGLLIGGGIGALAGSTGEQDCSQQLGCIEGFPTAGGAILGGLIGLSIGLALPSTRTIECK